MVSWTRTIKSPFKKARSFFNTQQQNQRDDKKSIELGHDEIHDHQHGTMDLQGEVMACGYEDVQVMWSILDKSKSRICTNLSQ